MRIGKMRHLVRIEAPNNISDGAGGEVTAWASLATVWAELLPQGGTKIDEADLISIGQQRYKLHMRYRRDVTPDCRLMWIDNTQQTPLRIDSVADIDGRRTHLVIQATAGVPT
jgi:SPP1 family predicted phage head-tail adaptor